MEILTKENLAGAKNCSHCSFQDFGSLGEVNPVSLLRIHLSLHVRKIFRPHAYLHQPDAYLVPQQSQTWCGSFHCLSGHRRGCRDAPHSGHDEAADSQHSQTPLLVSPSLSISKRTSLGREDSTLQWTTCTGVLQEGLRGGRAN